jgi:hypothetical protein
MLHDLFCVAIIWQRGKPTAFCSQDKNHNASLKPELLGGNPVPRLRKKNSQLDFKAD